MAILGMFYGGIIMSWVLVGIVLKGMGHPLTSPQLWGGCLTSMVALTIVFAAIGFYDMARRGKQ